MDKESIKKLLVEMSSGILDLSVLFSPYWAIVYAYLCICTFFLLQTTNLWEFLVRLIFQFPTIGNLGHVGFEQTIVSTQQKFILQKFNTR